MTRTAYISNAVKTKGFFVYTLVVTTFVSLAFRPKKAIFVSPILPAKTVYTAEMVSLLPLGENCESSTVDTCFDIGALLPPRASAPVLEEPTAVAEVATQPAPAPKEEKIERKKEPLKSDLERDTDIFIRAFKLEGQLEVWKRIRGKNEYEFVKSYPFCKNSGQLGPKRFRGDLQVPEGFYHINKFNPQSNYHLSLGISYPNQSDRILGNRYRLGGSIFIHGGCVTIGCIPITNEGIEELYALAEQAHQNGQKKINVHIFPARMRDATMADLYANYPQHAQFWQGLKEGYESFERTHRIPYVKVNNWGDYIVAAP